ncbi:MAG: hypothetical protein NZ928_03680 [Endomicrobia bacterium]|nr:hypothetical protein [Endomicrobiia bacterium]MDW8056114.1 hypothetical protein [Elusimicrobiota bacterium]
MNRKTCFITKYQYGDFIVDLDEYVLSLATNCMFGCEYCYLKFSKITLEPVIYENLDKFEQEVTSLFSNSTQKVFYFNFGETTDSFLTAKHFNIITDAANIISQQAKKYDKSCFVELRTKTNNIFYFNKKICFENVKLIYATSLSPQVVIDRFEHGTVPIKNRIETLIFAEKLGFLTGLRLEPIIIYPIYGIEYKDVVFSVKNLIDNYQQILKTVLEKIDFKNIHSITISCLRLTKKQFKELKQKKSKLCFFEMFLCPDGKYRYSRPIRTTIYNGIIDFIRWTYPVLYKKILLSFEFDYIWRNCGLEIKSMVEVSSMVG